MQNETAIQPRLLKINEAVRYSGLSRSALYLRVQRGELRLKKAGRRSLVERIELDALIDNLSSIDK